MRVEMTLRAVTTFALTDGSALASITLCWTFTTCETVTHFSTLATRLFLLFWLPLLALNDCCNWACKFSLWRYISFGEESNLKGDIPSPFGDSKFDPRSWSFAPELVSFLTGPKGLRREASPLFAAEESKHSRNVSFSSIWEIKECLACHAADSIVKQAIEVLVFSNEYELIK